MFKALDRMDVYMDILRYFGSEEACSFVLPVVLKATFVDKAEDIKMASLKEAALKMLDYGWEEESKAEISKMADLWIDWQKHTRSDMLNMYVFAALGYIAVNPQYKENYFDVLEHAKPFGWTFTGYIATCVAIWNADRYNNLITVYNNIEEACEKDHEYLTHFFLDSFTQDINWDDRFISPHNPYLEVIAEIMGYTRCHPMAKLLLLDKLNDLADDIMDDSMSEPVDKISNFSSFITKSTQNALEQEPDLLTLWTILQEPSAPINTLKDLENEIWERSITSQAQDLEYMKSALIQDVEDSFNYNFGLFNPEITADDIPGELFDIINSSYVKKEGRINRAYDSLLKSVLYALNTGDTEMLHALQDIEVWPKEDSLFQMLGAGKHPIAVETLADFVCVTGKPPSVYGIDTVKLPPKEFTMQMKRVIDAYPSNIKQCMENIQTQNDINELYGSGMYTMFKDQDEPDIDL